jgi:hypothetical protein
VALVTRANPTPRRLKVIDFDHAGRAVSVVGRRSGDVEEIDDELVSLRSHELRSPLASMVGFAELIDSGGLTEEQRQLYTGILVREGRRLTALINNALALQRLETGRQELDLIPVDVRSLIRRAVAAAGEDDLRPISAQVAEGLPLVCADAEAILEVLANFLSNARTFSPDGGSITIEAHLAGDMVEVSIRDHGVGIEAEALPKLFRKFYRADSGFRRLAPGAGLSLAVNQGIITAHGGQVAAGSRGRGMGAHFQFTLPISAPGSCSADVLIIDDDAVFAALMKKEFATHGLSSIRASDGETAELMLADMTPRAILVDLPARLPAGLSARLPVVVLSAKTPGPAEVSALEAAGALAVLPKEAGAPQAAVALIVEALAPKPVA